jgi:hypothetical protein
MDAKSGTVTPLSVDHTQPATNPKGGIMKTSKFAHIIAICFCIALFGQFAQSEEHGTKAQPKGSVLNQSATVAIRGNSMTGNGKVLSGGTERNPNDFDFDYKGSCPVNLKFEWSILPTAPTEIKYKIDRSDNAQSASKTMNAPKANTSVYVMDYWKLGANTAEFKDYKMWEKLAIESPNKSDMKLTVTLHCK